MSPSEKVEYEVRQLSARADEWLRAAQETKSATLKREYSERHSICRAKIEGILLAQKIYEDLIG